ncbi:hypothetical protein [Nocardia sp. NPDC050412]|uniref:hypothetical protein n=1 Tax=Nocardia sp. NPDC050412 TaxID=3364320 RepID=UPI0037B7BA7A
MDRALDGEDDRITRYLDRWFEARVELRPKSISSMSVSELQELLDRLIQLPTTGAAIADLLGIPIETKVGRERIRASFTTRVLQRQKAVREQLAVLLQQAQVDEFKDAVEAKVEDPKLRQDLLSLFSDFVQEQQAKALESKSAEAAAEMERAIHNAELRERKWRMWKEMLDREPVAVLVGAVLLGMLTLALIGAVFSHTPTPEIFSSALLLILGFFFGQAASGGGGRSRD